MKIFNLPLRGTLREQPSTFQPSTYFQDSLTVYPADPSFPDRSPSVATYGEII